MSDIELCGRCVLPSNFPGVTLRNGLCNYCADASEAALRTRKQELAQAIAAAVEKNRGAGGEYDCIVAFSGGKDSSYTLRMLVRSYGLSCLAVLVDNGFVSPQAQENCRAVATALGVDFLSYAPSFEFMRQMYVRSATGEGVQSPAAIKRASSICNSCISLINSFMLKTAVRYGAKLVAGGYLGGQVPRDAAVMTMDVDSLKEVHASALRGRKASLGSQAERYFGPPQVPGVSGGRITIINPMLAVQLSEREIIAAIGELGWIPTKDTGRNSSNCLLNDLGIAMHSRKHGFHPYVWELSEQVRSGAMARSDALEKMRGIPQLESLQAQITKLRLDVGSL
jgi:tRNA(Ile)-lysidine synthase TilS/MesJ